MDNVNKALPLIEKASLEGKRLIVFNTDLSFENVLYVMEELDKLGFETKAEDFCRIVISW